MQKVTPSLGVSHECRAEQQPVPRGYGVPNSRLAEWQLAGKEGAEDRGEGIGSRRGRGSLGFQEGAERALEGWLSYTCTPLWEGWAGRRRRL